MPQTRPEDYPNEKYNIIMLCGHKLYQQLTLSSDSESRYKLLETNVNPNTEPDNNDKRFNIYNPYNIHQNARKYFIQWISAIINLCSEGEDEEALKLYKELAGSKIPRKFLMALLGKDDKTYHARHRQYILEHSGFRAVVSPLLDRYDWMITYEKVGASHKVYAQVEYTNPNGTISKKDGYMEIITEKLPDEGPQPAPQEQQIRNNDYIPPVNDNNVIWMPTIERFPDRGKRKRLASNNP